MAESAKKVEKTAPLMLLQKPKNESPVSDIHRFFEQTGSNYINGRANDQNDVWHFRPPTKMATTAELNLTKDPMGNSHKNLLV
jgi:hypothetical protein